MAIPRNNNHVSLDLQRRLMQESFPEFQFTKKGNYWIGKLKPTHQSPKYSVKLIYQPYSAPKVEVIYPVMRPHPKHTYPDGSLCLYYPSDHVWRGANLLAPVILTWAAEWLYCYEIWLASGEWIGEEAPHSIDKSPI